ncbi:Oxysterol-binding protein-domain-containing protein [Coniochaeta sp. 2T2.1]|nr:Oxysterol-binding protein-domain-containing protein [Coniochaeta sp. 2T2.1]
MNANVSSPSQSYIVRWVKVDEGHTISWSLQPHKKSINFGIVKHPGTGGTTLTSQSEDLASPPESQATSDSKSSLFAKRDANSAQDQLAKKGFIPVKWYGKCEADKVSIGTYDVKSGGMFGLVFDNTFSKQTSKTATFVLLTYPTGNPPQTSHLPNMQAGANANASRTSLGKYNSPRLGGVASDSVDSLHSHAPGGRTLSIAGRSEPSVATPSTYHVGTLMKRRRKKGQGYARRFFSLDYTTCTLSYYHNRNTSALRGAIPLSLAAIAADERRREISIDSGAEVWHLKASNVKEFNEWARALERASRIARGLETLPGEHSTREVNSVVVAPNLNPPDTIAERDREWQQVEALVSRVVGTRDALRRLCKDIAAQKQASPQSGATSSSYLSPTPALSEESESYFTPMPDKKPFWKRKASNATLTPHALSPPTAIRSVSSPNGEASKRKSQTHEERNIHDHCESLLSDLDSVVHEFSTLLATSKRRRMPVPTSATSRHSFESAASTAEEFFDAEDINQLQSQLMKIDNHSEEDGPLSDGDEADNNAHDFSSESSVAEEDDHTGDGSANLHPPKPKSLVPLPIDTSIQRRTTIPPATVLPPSLIAFVRKNVGKDLSTISMPVSANEPTSLLQRSAEQLEYADLLTLAAKQPTPRERILYVTAFAVSQFSGGRAKERAIRKPFNPLLGETFELLRTDKEVPGGFRLLVEKVSHRPVRLAMQADSASWSFAQSPAPTQKFWGKSAEIMTEGRVRVSLGLPDGTDERYSWAIATVFLRNVVMGEKYVEPVGTMTVSNDTTGSKATIEFKSKGMFGGRGEDVAVETFLPDGRHAGVGLVGTWTAGLKTTGKGGEAEQEIWKPGRLVDNAANTYGLTTFAASLNEITQLEKGHLPPTDSRLRPDQRLAEQGKLEEAEEWKVRLEEAQRRRRREMEERGEEWRPRWFVKAGVAGDGEEVWRIKGGKEGYWESRGGGRWEGCDDIFDA